MHIATRSLLLVAVITLASCVATELPTPSPAITSTMAPPPSATIAASTPSPQPIKTLIPTTSPAVSTPTALPFDAATLAIVRAFDAWCEESRALHDLTAFPMDLLARLSNGRSAAEIAQALGYATKCYWRPAAYGSGASEIVTVGAYRLTGALLWVDRGFWRMAPVPLSLGYLVLVTDHASHGGRELIFRHESGGSAGTTGFLVVEIDGPAATVSLWTDGNSGSQLGIRALDADRLLVMGRRLEDRPFGIASNCCLPDGHEWLWEWHDGRYVLVAERQAHDPYYAFNALLGAIDAHRPDAAADVATPEVFTEASRFFGPGRLWSSNFAFFGNTGEEEILRWRRLPNPLVDVPEPLRIGVSRYEPPGPVGTFTFERVGDGWIATGFAPAAP